MATSNNVGEVSGSDVYFSGGGAGSGSRNGIRGLGGGASVFNSGLSNSGGGGGAGRSGTNSGSGGSGVVILRMPTANYSGTTTGNPIVTTDGTDTILTYTSSGTYTA